MTGSPVALTVAPGSERLAADTPTPAPEATPTSGTQPVATTPPTHTVASAPAASTESVSTMLIVLLAIAAVALVGSHRIAAGRPHPRD